VIYVKKRARKCTQSPFLMEFWNSGELRRRRRRFGSPEKMKSTMDSVSASLKRSRWIL
jgi:hypothetical protein